MLKRRLLKTFGYGQKNSVAATWCNSQSDRRPMHHREDVEHLLAREDEVHFKGRGQRSCRGGRGG